MVDTVAVLTHPTPSQEAEVAETARRLSRAYLSFKPPKTRVSAAISPRVGMAPMDAAAAPPMQSFDWRDRIQISPPGSQGSCNACSSFAIAATIEATWLISHPGNLIAVSPGYIHTCVGHNGDTDANAICAEGIDLTALLGLLQVNGYAQSSPGDFPFPTSACAAAAILGTIASYAAIAGPNDAKNSIVNKGPLVADMYVWQDFFSYTTNRASTYVPDTTSAGPYLHTICVVGFGSTGWIIKNSYGPSWGDGQGFAIIPYTACGLLGGTPPAGGFPREASSITL